MLEDATVTLKLSELEELLNLNKCFCELKNDILDFYELKNIYAKCLECEYAEQGKRCLFCDLSAEEKIRIMKLNVNKFLQILKKYKIFMGCSCPSPNKIEIIYEDLNYDRIRN